MSKTNFEQLKRIRDLLASAAGDTLTYENWDDAFCRKRMRDMRDVIRAKIGTPSVMDLTVYEADCLGFGRWSEDSPIRLLPIWLHPFLCAGDALVDIDGVTCVVGTNEIDNDQRGGFLAYGIMPKSDSLQEFAQAVIQRDPPAVDAVKDILKQ